MACGPDSQAELRSSQAGPRTMRSVRNTPSAVRRPSATSPVRKATRVLAALLRLITFWPADTWRRLASCDRVANSSSASAGAPSRLLHNCDSALPPAGSASPRSGLGASTLATRPGLRSVRPARPVAVA